LSELKDTLGGHVCINMEIHFEARIERVKRFTWRLRLSELSNAVGSPGCLPLVAVIK